MKKPEHKGSYSLLILAMNIVLLLLAVMLYGRYTAVYQQQLRDENLLSIANLNQSAATNATALVESWDIKLDDVARYLERHPTTVGEALALLDDANSSDERQFELIGSDYTGYLAHRDDSGAYIPVSYQGSSYAELRDTFDSCANRDDMGIHFAPEFTDSHAAVKYFAICARVTLVDEGGRPAPYALMLASRARDVLAVFNKQGVFDGLSTVLIRAGGDYIVSSEDFKSDNFFQFLYVYNDLSLDQRGAIQQQIALSGSGELYYKNAMGQDCVFRYAKMSTNDWYCVTSVPLTSFREPVFSINYALYAVLALLVVLCLDVLWLRSINSRLRVSMNREKEASEAKTDFLSRMSHDIRTPLNGIIGLTTLAMDESNSPQTVEYLENIKASGDFLLGLVNDILDLSKVESGKVELNPEPYSSEEFCKYIAAVVEPLCQERSQTLRVTPPDDNRPLMFDRLRLNQIFFNLLSNAVKYTPPGGLIELYWDKKPVSADRVEMVFTVRDNGVGMSEDFQKHMFESFTQERAETASTGAGLGLSIVWSLVKLMDGSIDVRSAPGQGTTFTVRLAAQVSAEVAEAPAAFDETALVGKRVLLCEDNEVNTLIAERLLGKWGVTTEAAPNGRAGLEMFAASPVGGYDAVLMDIRMPEMNGLEATRAIRELDRADAASVPIIAMTANAYDTDVRNCLDAGMNAHLGKPVQPQQLRETLIRLLQKKVEP